MVEPVKSKLTGSTLKGWLPAVVFLGSYVAARLILGIHGLSTLGRVGAALLPVMAYIYFLSSFIRGIRELDELERRIQLEALSFAFPSATVVMLALGLFELATGLPPEDFSYRHVWAFFPLLYFVGLAMARRRYQ